MPAVVRTRRSAVLAAFVIAGAIWGGILSTPSRVMAQPANAGNASVADAIANFTSGDREKVVAGRQALLSRLSGNPAPTVLIAYAREVSSALMPVVNGEDPHAKLNAAIFLQRLADQSGSTDLAPPIAALIKDESPAIAAWGLRASANVLPRVLGNPVLANNDQLLPAIYDALAKHASNEAVAIDVYAALTKVLAGPNAERDLGAAAIREATPRVVDALHKVIASRVVDFGTGNVAEPGAEGQAAVGFLARASTWQAMSDAQKTKTVGMLLALLDGAAAEMAAIKEPNAAGRGKMAGVRGLLQFTAQGLEVISNLANKGADVAEKVAKLKTIGAGMTPAQVTALVSDAETALAAAFPGAVAPATQSATTPTVAP